MISCRFISVHCSDIRSCMLNYLQSTDCPWDLPDTALPAPSPFRLLATGLPPNSFAVLWEAPTTGIVLHPYDTLANSWITNRFPDNTAKHHLPDSASNAVGRRGTIFSHVESGVRQHCEQHDATLNIGQTF